ncbi:MAG: PTS system fructose-specific EIIABC component [Verrucomicrobiae bacterium]|nr:PTS system fructose-specific EIIABC component [Verrucomicrobiae bacterium]
MSKINKVAALLRADRINLNIQSQKKNDALREVAQQLGKTGCVTDFDAFFAEILERERVSNTALGHDVAIPHARTEQCREILIAVGRNTNGISFDAKDGQPVRLIFMIGTPKQMVTEYLRVVGNLARLLRQDTLRQALLDAPDVDTFIQLIDQAEG